MDMMNTVLQQLNRGHLLVVALSLCSFATTATSHHCDQFQYWDARHRLCRPCTKCPLNQIIRRPCRRHSDTVCGPFREFSYFNQLKDGGGESSYTSYEFETPFTHSHNSSGLEASGDFPQRQAGGRVNHHLVVVEKDDEEYWKSLAFALIGVVCVLIFVATIVVLIACKKLHGAAVVKYAEEEDDDDSGYVVIRSIRPPNTLVSPGRGAPYQADLSYATRALLMGGDDFPAPTHPSPLPPLSGRQDVCATNGVHMYVPVRQMLNYDADDVFESEDNLAFRASCSVFPQQDGEAAAVENCKPV